MPKPPTQQVVTQPQTHRTNLSQAQEMPKPPTHMMALVTPRFLLQCFSGTVTARRETEMEQESMRHSHTRSTFNISHPTWHWFRRVPQAELTTRTKPSPLNLLTWSMQQGMVAPQGKNANRKNCQRTTVRRFQGLVNCSKGFGTVVDPRKE
jgi:hypothetical protein